MKKSGGYFREALIGGGFLHDFGVVGRGLDGGVFGGWGGWGVGFVGLITDGGFGGVGGGEGEEFGKGFCDEGGGVGTAAGFDSGVGFIDGGEGVFGIADGEVSGEPGGGSLFVFWTPLCGAGLGGDFDAFDLAAMSGAAAAFGDRDEGFLDGFEDFGIDGELVAEAVRVGGDDFVVEGLDLLDKAGLVEVAAGGEDGHGLGHLERSDENVALADAHVGDVALEDFSFVDAEHVVVVGHVAGGFGFDGEACAASEAEEAGPLDDGLAAGFEADLVEVGIAGLGHGLLEVEHAGSFFFPVAEDDVAHGEARGAVEFLIGGDGTALEGGEAGDGFEGRAGGVGTAEGSWVEGDIRIVLEAVEVLGGDDRDEDVGVEGRPGGQGEDFAGAHFDDGNGTAFGVFGQDILGDGLEF